MKMKKFEKSILGVLVMALILWLYMFVPIQRQPLPHEALAITKFSEAIPGVQTMALTFSRVLTTSGSAVTPIDFSMPFKAEVLGVSAVARTLDTGSGNEVYTVDVKAGGISILSAPIPLYQTTMGVGTIATKSIAADSRVTVVIYNYGTTPSMTDLTTLLTIRRTN